MQSLCKVHPQRTRNLPQRVEFITSSLSAPSENSLLKISQNSRIDLFPLMD